MSDRRLRYFQLVRRDPRRDVDDELRFHLETRVSDLEARGLSPEEARRRAEAEFGDLRAVREQTVRIDERMVRRERRAEWLAEGWRDARQGLRALRNSPAFAVTAVLCAALGIGVTAAVVSAAYAILVRPLPYPDADRLVAIYGENTVKGYTGSNISWPDFVSWRDGNTTFSAIGMWTWSSATLAGAGGDGGDAEQLQGADVTANLFPLLGVTPAMGRAFLPEEEVQGRDGVVLLSHRLWERRFAGDSAVVGRPIMLDGRSRTVVGVMPPGFNFPDRGDLWVPFATDPAREDHGSRGYAGAIGRLKDGVSLAQATADLHRIDAALVLEFPDENYGWRAELTPLRDDLVGDLRTPLRVFLGAVALVLLMVCANVANLMLARGAARSREIAVRTALGASRARLGRQLMTESLLVAVLGGALGVAIAWGGVRLLRYGFPDQVPPFYVSLQLDGAALAFVAGITLVTGVLFGTVPALRGTRVDVSGALRDGTRAAGGTLHRSRLRSGLVVGEIALSVVLMVGAMLLARSYQKLAGTELGFDEHGALTARITLPGGDYPESSQVLAFYDRLLERLRALPGVTAVGTAQGIPFSGWDWQSETRVEGAPPPRRGEELVAHFQYVTPDYFRAIGVDLVKGRWLTPADADTLHPAVLVNEQMVAQGFGGRDPIGRRLRVGGDQQPMATVVGVVRGFRHYRLPQPMGPAVYFPYPAWPMRQEDVVVRTTQADPRALVPALRDAVRELDPRVALYQVQTLEEAVSRSLWRQRLQGSVLGVFAALALALACIGLYGVISYAVAQRTRELGVRMALGATRRDVLWLVFAQSGRLVAAGVGVGLVAAWFATRLLESLLYGVQPADLPTFATVPGCLALVALLAALVPAYRATRVDPVISMRTE